MDKYRLKTNGFKIALMALVLFFGCDQPADEGLPSANYDFTGTWRGNLTGATFATAFTCNATHVGNGVDGTMYTDAGFNFDIDGTAWGDEIELVCEQTNNPTYVLTCRGTSDGFYSSGTWSDNAGQSGEWSGWKDF